ncbi:MAG TPA: hypothetical protein VF553_17395 [Pyrinomonadaceae bacterium]|jgi:hypothetical protein
MSRTTEKSPSQELKDYGLDRGFAIRRRPWIYVSLVVFAALALGFFTHLYLDTQKLNGIQVATAVVALGAFVLGYQQWRAARFEASIEKFYERLEASNKRLQEWATARELIGAVGDQQSFQQSMYVFSELDNLDYVVQKYKYGYMSAEQALRGVKTFKARCVHERFRERADGCLELGGYSTEISDIFDNVCKEIIRERAERLSIELKSDD